MTYFEQFAKEVSEKDHLMRVKWWRPGMTLEEAYETIRALPIDPKHEIENPRQPEQGGWNQFRGDTFIQIRLRELFEGYAIEHGDPYFIGLMGQAGFERNFLLWHDAELREELIWPLFSLVGTQEVSFTSIEKYYWTGWAESLVALVDEGLLDRDRLLDEMLTALNRGFPAYRVRWFTQHYEDFAPTEEETTKRQHLLIAAMGSGVGSTTTFAVKQLSRLSELDADGFVAAGAHALSGSKTTAITALKMLEKIAIEREDLAAGIADAVQTGLYHAKDDVVRRSAALLRTLGRGELIDAARDVLSPVMALELLGPRDASPEVPAETSAPLAQPAEAQPVAPWTDEDALFHTRELLAAPDAVGFALLVAWLAETGPRALEILKPVLPNDDPSSTLPDVRWLLVQCRSTPAEVEEANAYRLTVDMRRESLLRVVAIVHGLAPTRTLLSTPTDTFGRVDNKEFARRLATYSTPEDVWPDDALLAHLRLVDFQEDSTGRVPLQGVRAGCDCVLWTLPEDRCPGCGESGVWLRTSQGWKHQSTQLEEKLPFLASAPFSVTYSPAGRAIVAPSCLDAYTHDMEDDLDEGMSNNPEKQDPAIVEVLTWHPGEWSPHTSRFLGKAMANKDTEIRAIAAELVATSLPRAIGADTAAKEWSQLEDVILGRWAASLEDAATLNPTYVCDLLAQLLPQLDHKSRDLGKLIELYRNVRLATGESELGAELREWLATFSGKSKAALAASALLKEA